MTLLLVQLCGYCMVAFLKASPGLLAGNRVLSNRHSYHSCCGVLARAAPGLFPHLEHLHVSQNCLKEAWSVEILSRSRQVPTFDEASATVLPDLVFF